MSRRIRIVAAINEYSRASNAREPEKKNDTSSLCSAAYETVIIVAKTAIVYEAAANFGLKKKKIAINLTGNNFLFAAC